MLMADFCPFRGKERKARDLRRGQRMAIRSSPSLPAPMRRCREAASWSHAEAGGFACLVPTQCCHFYTRSVRCRDSHREPPEAPRLMPGGGGPATARV